MSTKPEMLQPGPYIDSHWGHYQSVEVILFAMDLGYEDHALDEANLYRLIEAYRDNTERLTLNEKAGTTLVLTEDGRDHYSIAECVYETADDAIDYINEHYVPEGYWFGHHPDMGDMGVYEIEED